MMIPSKELLIGYDYDAWYGYSEKLPVTVDASTKNNTETLICGMSGSGKSYLTNQYFARICLHGGDDSVVYFADFKQDDSFVHLRKCPRYYPYDKTIEALDEVYEIMHKRQCGEDSLRNFVTLIWDEYIANILALLGTEKKKAEAVMHKVSEILMLGRSLAVRLVIACQRPDASAFPTGSRLNFGVIIIVGATLESMEKEYQEECGIKSEAVVDGYQDFIFVNRFGNVQHQGTLNKALRRIIRDCNFEILDKDHRDNAVILPKFSNHSLRHTFTTRMCEAGVNIKAMQDILGHADAETTMQIYAEATKDLKKSEIINFQEYFNRIVKEKDDD